MVEINNSDAVLETQVFVQRSLKTRSLVSWSRLGPSSW